MVSPRSLLMFVKVAAAAPIQTEGTHCFLKGNSIYSAFYTSALMWWRNFNSTFPSQIAPVLSRATGRSGSCRTSIRSRNMWSSSINSFSNSCQSNYNPALSLMPRRSFPNRQKRSKNCTKINEIYPLFLWEKISKNYPKSHQKFHTNFHSFLS